MALKLGKAKDFLPGPSLKYMLHEHLSGPEEPRSLEEIHASELTRPNGFCPRYVALHDVTGKPQRGGWLSTSERVTYDIGNDLQDRIVSTFADMGKAVGDWRCLACGLLYVGCKRPAQCEAAINPLVACGCTAFHPVEHRFKSAKNDASCGIDHMNTGFGPKLKVVEIKTMDKEQFKGLIAPLAEHRQRTNLYLRIVSESDDPLAKQVDTEEARILYTTKGGYGAADGELAKWGLSDQFSPFKEFKVARDDAKTEPQAVRAQVVHDFRAGLVGMPAGICATSMVHRARSCGMCKACFSGDHPALHEWPGCV